MFSKIYFKVSEIREILISKGRMITLTSVIAVPFLLFLITELTRRGGLDAYLTWIVTHKINALSYFLFLLLLHLSLLMLFNRLFISMLVISVPTVVIAIVSYNKMMIRELPLLPWNMGLLKELVMSISLASELIWIFILSTLAAIPAAFAAFYMFAGIKSGLKLKKRVGIFAASICILIPIAISFTYSCSQTDTVAIYNQKGLIPSMIYYWNKPYMQKPEDYSKESVMNTLKSKEPKKSVSKINELPDIIMIMGEAFWDPSELSEIKFSEDPVPNLHKLSKEGISGQLLVNSFGGNTTNTEFEALSGMSMSFVAPDTSVYNDFYHGQFPTLPYYLVNLGYTAEAIHPYYGDFLNRQNAYTHMGFQKFHDISSFTSPKRAGNYITDFSAGEKILELYDKHKKESSGNPYFSFTVTIQNHYDFKSNWYKNNIEIRMPKTIDANDAKMLRGYINGVRDTDALLGRLSEYFSKENRHAIVVFFGDHIPALGKNFKFFKNSGYVNSDSMKLSFEDRRKLHMVPFVIWDNYTKAHGDMGCVSAAYLQTVLFKEYELPMNQFQRFLSDLMEEATDYGLSAWSGEKDHIEIEAERKYRLIQYDLLFGKGYSKELALKLN
jgi:phosphoglycerol transferase MdoB-like AlkP superfamily enzyme